MPIDRSKTVSSASLTPAHEKFGAITSVATRFTVAIGALIILAMCIFWLISNYNTQNIMQQQADSLGQALARQAATMVTELVLANDRISMNVVLGQLTSGSIIAEAAVLNIDGDVISASVVDPEPPRSLLPYTVRFGEYTAPITLLDVNAGSVRIRLDMSYIEAGLSNNLLFILAATFLILIVAITLSITYFQYLVAFPIRLLNYTLQGIRFGEVENCPVSTSNDEISRLIRQYNTTAEFLNRYSFIKGRFTVDGGLQESASAKDEIFNAAILCIRLTNFQYLASTQHSSELIALLNRYHYLVENISGLYNGKINYCEDGEIVIGFYNEQLDDELCFYAVCAGQLFIKLLGIILNSLDGSADGNDGINVKFRLAIHFGRGTAGLYSPITKEYNNLSGDCLDLTREICSECPDNSLLVSKAAYDQAGGRSRLSGEEFSATEGDAQISTYLCSNAMASYRSLLEKQAEKIAKLMVTDSYNANE